ncbi:MAG: DUF2284 domain-containing protein [Oscillospiraceae bacterium]|jgi:predicted metal-binding protein|nr:DUF2284 domain-containing protein [Oscillospiraceae bacterium]
MANEHKPISPVFDEIFRSAGVFASGLVDSKKVAYTQEVRKYCEDNVCREYGKTWACPPAIGTVDECAARAKSYEHMLVFTVKYDIADSLDMEGMLRGMRCFRSVANRVDDRLKDVLTDYLLLGNEGCGICEDCAYPSPCRFPDKVYGSIEGYGIFVNKLAEQAGVLYNNGENTITYFGAVLYNEKALRTGVHE